MTSASGAYLPSGPMMQEAIREAATRHKQGLPCWCEGTSGHAGWLVCAEFRSQVLAASGDSVAPGGTA